MRDLIREHGTVFLITAAAICGTLLLERLDEMPVDDVPVVQIWDETKVRALVLSHDDDPPVYWEGWVNGVVIHSNLFMGSTEVFESFPDNAKPKRKRR